MSKRVELDSGLAKAAVWSGIALIVAMIVAQGFMMHFIPPPSPADSAAEIAQMFRDNTTGIRVGLFIAMLAFGEGRPVVREIVAYWSALVPRERRAVCALARVRHR